jgi:hypothetical protein
MTHLCCRPCRVRFAASTARASCPRCHGPLSSLAPPEAMGYALSAPAGPHWRLADLHALARAVANADTSIRQ